MNQSPYQTESEIAHLTKMIRDIFLATDRELDLRNMNETENTMHVDTKHG